MTHTWTYALGYEIHSPIGPKLSEKQAYVLDFHVRMRNHTA